MRAWGRGCGRRGRAALTLLAAGSCTAVLTGGGPAHAGTRPAGVTPVSAAGTASAAAGTISTLAGGTGAPGPARKVAVVPCGLQARGSTLYVGSYSVNWPNRIFYPDGDIQAIDTATGRVATVAGNGTSDGGTSGVPATETGLSQSCGTATDAAGNLIVADQTTVQVVAATTGTFYGQAMTAGNIYTVAGQPGQDRRYTSPGDGGPATAALLYDATGVAVDAAGNILVADSGLPQKCLRCVPSVAAVVRVIAATTGTFYGQAMTAGDIYQVAGSYTATDPGDGGAAQLASLGSVIDSIHLDAAGNLLIPEYGVNTGFMSTPADVRVAATTTGTFYGQAMTAGDIYTIAGTGQLGTSGNGGPALNAELADPGEVVPDAAGNLVVADRGQVRVIAEHTGTFYGQPMTTGDIYGIAGTAAAGYSGDGGLATAAGVTAANVAVDGHGNVVIGGAGRVRVVAERTGTFYGQAMTTGDIYTVAGHGLFYSTSGTPGARMQLYLPGGAAVDSDGDVLTTDQGHCVIWFGAGQSRQVFGRNVTAGDYYKVGGNGTCGSSGSSGVPATQTELGDYTAASLDHWGNVVTADYGDNSIQVIAASTGTFYGQAMTAGDIYVIITGGPENCASGLSYPTAVWADQAGNLLVADRSCSRLWVFAASTGTFYGQAMTADHLYDIAGTGSYEYSGDGGPATQAGVDPAQVVTDATGNIVVADLENNRIRVIAEQTGTFYGQAMTAGDIYTIAGTGAEGDTGDGGLATAAELDDPNEVAVDPHGNVVLSDALGSYVRVIAGQAGTFYGLPMTAGHLYLLIGSGANPGTDGLGDGGPATGARVHESEGLAVRPDGDLVIADTFDSRLRTVAG